MSKIATKTRSVQLDLTGQYIQIRLSRGRPAEEFIAAWNHFYNTHHALIRRLVVAHGLRGADVDDCAQEVWSVVIRRFPDLRHGKETEGLRPWLCIVVRNKVNDVRRREKRRRARRIDAIPEPTARASDPAALCQEKCEKTLIKRLVNELQAEVSHTNSRLIEMRLIEGRAVADVAAELGLTPQQVWFRQHRLLAKIRARVSRR